MPPPQPLEERVHVHHQRTSAQNAVALAGNGRVPALGVKPPMAPPSHQTRTMDVPVPVSSRVAGNDLVTPAFDELLGSPPPHPYSLSSAPPHPHPHAVAASASAFAVPSATSSSSTSLRSSSLLSTTTAARVRHSSSQRMSSLSACSSNDAENIPPPPMHEAALPGVDDVLSSIATLPSSVDVAASSLMQGATPAPPLRSHSHRLSIMAARRRSANATLEQRMSLASIACSDMSDDYTRASSASLHGHGIGSDNELAHSPSSHPSLIIDDALTEAQRQLKDIKARISAQSKRNFLLERDVRYLDSRIALLIQNRMAMDEEISSHLRGDEEAGQMDASTDSALFPDDRRKQLYGNLFFLLQTEPRLVAHLTRLVTLSEIDTLLQTVMFTLYGNQYDNREEHLLLTMFQSVLTEQIDSATDFGSLLRANTPASRMMTTYTRRGPGQQYLKFVLSANINRLLEEPDLQLEINPLKVYEQLINDDEVETGRDSTLPRGVTADQAAENERVRAVVEPRAERLMEIAEGFLTTIMESLEHVPYGIRWICKQIMLLVTKNYPEESNWNVCSLIGGFFFLRFLNPAIITPQSYMIVDAQPSQHPRRTLTLLAKMLQNLANKPTYSKEMYMMALNPFVERNKERITRFLNELCDVEDFYESLELDQYMALSLKDININISVNEIYSTHALLLKHCETICSHVAMTTPTATYAAGTITPASNRTSMTPEQSYFVSCHHLRLLLNDLGAKAPEQLPRKNNKTLPLSLFARWEIAPILFPQMAEAIQSKEQRLGGDAHTAAPVNSSTDGDAVDASAQDADLLFAETKSMIVQIMRAQTALISAIGSAIDTPTYVPTLSVTHVPTHYKPSLLRIDELLSHTMEQSSRCAQVRGNLHALEDHYHHPMIRRADGYYDLGQAIHQEFLLLAALMHKLHGERESLEMVFKTICDHNQYLRSQLESYKAYLQNVRIQATSGGGSSVALPKPAETRGATSMASPKIGTRPFGRSRGASGGEADVLPSAGTAKLAKKATYAHSTTRLKFTHAQLEKDGIITESGVPENRRSNIYFSLRSPAPGSFLIGLHYKGREKPIVEVDLQLDDLLEKQMENVHILDLEYVQLNVNKVLHLLNKSFMQRK